VIPADAWPKGDRLTWDDDDTRTHHDFTDDPPTTRPYTDAENAEADDRDETRLVEANSATIRKRATDAAVSNRIFLDLTAPTNAQTLAEVRLLARLANALIRLAGDDYTGTD